MFTNPQRYIEKVEKEADTPLGKLMSLGDEDEE